MDLDGQWAVVCPGPYVTGASLPAALNGEAERVGLDWPARPGTEAQPADLAARPA